MTYPQSVKYLVDVHCHPTDSKISDEAMQELPLRVAAMATRSSDQQRVADLATRWPDKVIPCFGFHPWFTHTISTGTTKLSKTEHYASLFLPGIKNAETNSDFARILPLLPEPTPLAEIIATTRSNLERFPNAMLGEVGLDRAFRIPYFPYRETVEEGSIPEDEANDYSKKLTPFHVPIEHQISILEAQIELAVELGRNISIHSVKAPSFTVDLFERMSNRHGAKWRAVSIDMHSCCLSAQVWHDTFEKKHKNVFISLSTGINARNQSHASLIRACSPSRILVESDFHSISESAQRTWDMLLIVAQIRGWRVEQTSEEVLQQSDDDEHMGAVKRMMLNWDAFVRGGHESIPLRPSNQVRKLSGSPHVEEDWQNDDNDIGTVVY